MRIEIPAPNPNPNDLTPTSFVGAERLEISAQSLLAFDAVARYLNFSKAAKELGVTTTAISKTIKSLESKLAVRLFTRNTRQVLLTESGRQLIDAVEPALAAVRRSVSKISECIEKPEGLLRIKSSYVAYSVLIEPHLGLFSERYPDIVLDIIVDDGSQEVIGDGFDAGIRLGHAVYPGIFAKPLGARQRNAVVTTPRFLEENFHPVVPEDLLRLDCIRQTDACRANFVPWAFHSVGRQFNVEVAGSFIVNEMRSAVSAVSRGLGVAYVLEAFVARQLSAGSLVEVLDKYVILNEPFYLYYSDDPYVPAKLAAFLEFFHTMNKPAS